jgi:hypothetical protein
VGALGHVCSSVRAVKGALRKTGWRGPFVFGKVQLVAITQR